LLRLEHSKVDQDTYVSLLGRGAVYLGAMSDALAPKTDHPIAPALERHDLAERLVRLRDRMVREGRKAGIEKIDRAIDEARSRRNSDPR
jgi:hypothetical protein